MNGAVNNYNTQYKGTMRGGMTGGTYDVIDRRRKGTDEDYFLNTNLEYCNVLTLSSNSLFEKGHLFATKIANMGMFYDYMMDAAQQIMGEPGYTWTYDMSSYWNDGGLRSPQMYLIVAECELHKGNIELAMENLDKIRVGRIDSKDYKPLSGNVSTMDEAVKHLKQVTCNELVFSVDLFITKKRWNQIEGWQETYSRTLAGKTYTLAPDSKLWIFPFPQDVIKTNPNITKQNYEY